MPAWRDDLAAALAAGDPAHMAAMLSRVPKDVIQTASPYLEAMAKTCAADGKYAEALTFYSQMIEVLPGNVDWHAERAKTYFKLDRLAEAIQDARRVVALQPERALGYRLVAEAHDGMRERSEAIAAYRQVLHLDPKDEKSRQRLRFLESEIQKEVLLKQTLDPQSSDESLSIELAPLPEVTFDPALLADADIPETCEATMVEAIKKHLSRYSGLHSSKNVLARIEDPEWVSAWDSGLRSTKDSVALFHGSELGVFALRARHHGAKRLLLAEAHSLDARITGGIVRKHLLLEWHALHGSAIQSWTEEARQTSFENFGTGIDVFDQADKQFDDVHCDYLVFPNLDHSLLGTGIAKTIRGYRERGLLNNARVLPARARVFAQAIQWNYQASSLQLDLMNTFRWSFYPQALGLSKEHWTDISEPCCVGELDFEKFTETQWDIELLSVAAGRLDGIIYWYELDLGGSTISNAPDSVLTSIKPAVQFADGIVVESGQSIRLRMHVTETRLFLETQPPPARIRTHQLPVWYVPMLLDRQRNEAYRAALERRLNHDNKTSVLDVGAGCGLLSIMASQAGARHVTACEISAPIASVARQIVAINKCEHAVNVVNKDCRKLVVTDDLPERADLAVFELFDCSLIGEGVLHFLAYAREHLLKQNARYLPIAGHIRAMIVQYRLDRIFGVDVNLLNPYRFSQSFINVDASTLPFRALTLPFDVFSFDFSNATPVPRERTITPTTIAAGTAGAVLFWFDLQLDESTCLSNAPDSTQSLHWKQGLQFLPELLPSAELQLAIVAKHDGSGLSFQWKEDAIPKTAFSSLPRFDPRWWQLSKELDNQTRSLLNHCMQRPDEFEKVCELAKRFAIDPAKYNIDPIIAQKFAATFFQA